MESEDASGIGRAITGIGAVVAAVMARKALTAAWSMMTGEEPPQNPAAADTSWREALLWGAAAGLVAGLARTIGQRAAAGAWANVSGDEAAELA